MEAREITIVSRLVGLSKEAHSKWNSTPGRWWFAVGGVLLTFIFEGPQQWLAHRLANMSALLELPNHLWGQWLIILFCVSLIVIGLIRSFNSKHEVTAAKEAAEVHLRDKELSWERRVTTARAEGAIAGFAEASLIPKKMAGYYAFHRDIVLLDETIIEMGREINNYKRRCSRWIGEESFRSDPESRYIDFSCEFLELIGRNNFLKFTPPTFQGRLSTENLWLEKVDHPEGPSDAKLYDPASNRTFREQLTRHIANLDSYLSDLHSFRTQQSKALDALAEDLQKDSII